MKPRSDSRRSAPAASRQYLHSVEQIGDMLRARIRDLCSEWKLNGYVEQHEFVALNPLRADRHHGSFRICLTGELRGLIRDFSDGKNWSPMSFTADLWFGGNNVQAIKWSRAWLGLDGTDPNSLQKTRRAVADADAQAEKRDAEAEEKARRKRAYAQHLWLSLPEGIAGTPADRYLAGRGIDIGALQFAPGALKYHPALSCRELGEDATLPAMVGIIQNGQGENLALHRTYLDVREDGSVAKAPLREAKKVLGRYRGGYISLQKGIVIDRETGEWKKNPPLSRCKSPVWVEITEGIENGLSVAIADLAARVVACVSLANMACIEFPPIVEGVVLWRDNDPAGSPAATAFDKAVAWYQRQGKRVKIVRMPAGVKDVNDLLRGK